MNISHCFKAKYRFLAILWLGLILTSFRLEGSTLYSLGAPAEGMTLVAEHDSIVAEPPPQAPTSCPLLWRLGTDPPSFLYGTIHSADVRVLNLPVQVSKALDEADAVFTEIPMDPATSMKAAQLMMLSEDQSLENLIPTELYERAGRYIQTKGFDISMFSKLQVWVLPMTLSFLDALRDMAMRPALDQRLYSEAVKNDKEVGGIETIQEQVSALSSLSREENLAFLETTLDLLEAMDAAGTDYMEQMIELYLEGDETALFEFVTQDEMMQDDISKKFFQTLLLDRNHRMAERIAERVEQNPDQCMFFAIGAGHLGGPEGLLELLTASGVVVERVVQECSASR